MDHELKTIMIIDDDSDLVDLLAERTESFGFECHGYNSIDDAVANLRTILPDLIPSYNRGHQQKKGSKIWPHFVNNWKT